MPNELQIISELLQKKKYKEASVRAKELIKHPELGDSFLPIYADALRKGKQFEELVECYEQNWKAKNKSFSNWDNRHYANALRKLEKYDEALEVCKKVREESPDFKPILSEYYWAVFYRDIKHWYIKDVSEGIIVPFAKEVKEHFENAPNRHFTPYQVTILYIAEYYNYKGEYEKCMEWLKGIKAEELSKVGKLKKGDEIILFVPQKAKYYNFVSNSLINLERYDEAKPIIIEALYDFPFWSNLSKHLLSIAEKEFECRGVTLFNKMLEKVGFEDNEIKNNYLSAMLGDRLYYASNWEEGFIDEDEYNQNFQTVAIARALKRLYKEIEIKNGQFVENEINFQMVSASEVGDFVFCPASYSLQKSFQVSQDPESNVELIWDEKRILLDRFNDYQKTGELNKTFTEEEKERIGEIPNGFIEIFKSKILQESKRNKKVKIFFNGDKNFSGVPDYWLSNNFNFVTEEKFSRHNSKKEELLSPYPNHKAEVLSQIFELQDLKATKGYVVYWLWNFERVEYKNKTSTDYRLQKVKLFEIQPDENNKKYYENVIAQIRKFNEDKDSAFNIKSLLAIKCVNCGVSQFCFHKTGRISKLRLPYNKE